MPGDVVVPHRPGLRALLPEMPWGPEQGPMIVIRGRAGSGKTVFAADLVLGTLWSNRFHVAVFDVEQGRAQARQLLENLGYVRDLRSPTGRDDDPQLVSDRFYYQDVWACDWPCLHREIGGRITEWEKERVPRGQAVIVIDSLNALSSDPVARADMRELRVEINREQGWWLVIVCEADPGEDTDYGFLDYEADVLFWLTVERPGLHSYSRRMLEIVKCRNTRHARGRHHFVITTRQADDGNRSTGSTEAKARVELRVYPSLPARFSAWKKLGGTRYGPRERTGVHGLSDMLGSGTSEEGVSEAKTRGVLKGSVTAYVGGPGSRKGPCALHFALEETGGPEDDPDWQLKEGRTLIVSLGASEPEVSELASRYKPLRENLLREYEEERFLFRDDEQVTFRRIAPGPTSAAACIAAIEGWLHESPKASRVIVTDLSEIEPQLPLIAAEGKSFSTALVQLCRTFPEGGLTSLLVETTGGAAPAPLRSSSAIAIGGLADNVVEFRHLFFYGSMHLGVSVTWRHGTAGETGFRELVTREPGRTSADRYLEVRDNLRGFTDLFTGEPKHAPINIYVYEDNELQRAFNQRLGDMVARALPGVPDSEHIVKTFTGADACYTFRALERATDTPQPDIRIAQIDEFWVKELARSDKLAACPEDLYHTEEGVAGLGERFYGLLAKREYVPDRINVSLLAAFDVRGKVLNAFSRECGEHAGRDWRDLRDRAREELSRLSEDRAPRCAFDFGKGAMESWSCMLLEILSSAGAFRLGPRSNDDQRAEVKQLVLSSDPAVEQLKAFSELFWLGREVGGRLAELERLKAEYQAAVAPDSQRAPDRAFLDGEDPGFPQSGEQQSVGKTVQPLFCRLWYTELVALLRRRSGSLAHVAIFRMPGDDAGGKSMQGEWYWCVLRGGVSEHAGWEIVDWLTKNWMGARQYVSGIGLPPQKCFYERPEAKNMAGSPFMAADGKRNLTWVWDSLWNDGLSRVDIPEYPAISPLLARLLYDVLCAGAKPEVKDLRAEVERLAKEAEQRIRAISSEALKPEATGAPS